MSIMCIALALIEMMSMSSKRGWDKMKQDVQCMVFVYIWFARDGLRGVWPVRPISPIGCCYSFQNCCITCLDKDHVWGQIFWF